MILLALALVQPEVQPAPPPVDQDIVVLGRRLKGVRFKGGVDRNGQVLCRLTRSSGDAEIDAIPCRAVHECAVQPVRSSRDLQKCMAERLEANLRLLGVKGRERAP